MSLALRLGNLFLLCALTAPAVDFSALKPEGYLSDFARVADRQSRAEIEKYCSALEASTGVQLALVTLPTLAGEPVEDVANLLFRKWGIGRKETNQGILLLLVIGDRRSRLEVGYGLEPVIPDGFAGSILRQMRPALRAGRYGEAMLEASQTIGARIAQAKGVELRAPPPRQPGPRRDEAPPLPLLVGGLIILLWLLGIGAGRRRRRMPGGFVTAMVLGNLLGRGMFGGRSGGGFGGFDSSDSFGGFGGGDSGGGGASSSW